MSNHDAGVGGRGAGRGINVTDVCTIPWMVQK
jgi:hypothetical protein